MYVCTINLKCVLIYPCSTDEDFVNSTSITVNPGSSRACIDFTEVIVDDNIALEGRETFIILVGNSMAMVTIIDDDG